MDPLTPRVNTARLLLRPYAPADEADFVAITTDVEVQRYVGDGPLTEEEARALFGRILTRVYAERLFPAWAVVDRESGVYLGHGEVKPRSGKSDHEIVYFLARGAWGRGLGTELASVLARYGLEVLALPRVVATVAPENAASLRVLEKVGMRRLPDEHDARGPIAVLAMPDASPG